MFRPTCHVMQIIIANQLIILFNTWQGIGMPDITISAMQNKGIWQNISLLCIMLHWVDYISMCAWQKDGSACNYTRTQRQRERGSKEITTWCRKLPTYMQFVVISHTNSQEVQLLRICCDSNEKTLKNGGKNTSKLHASWLFNQE